ncbi:CDP-glucose 4,6-dehydratase (plasmid) [Telmatobacter bradus]|uniref:CDP-glucose 4,6-dehydratase n=1 Tax=Telmatobacter bradus TaxID=474953 RepID=UPI003B43B16F
MEGVGMTWKNKRVLLTGHTGFKGSWLSLWLQKMGAEVCGLALEPPTAVNLYMDAQVEKNMRSVLGDIRDADLVSRTVQDFRPEVVFHLAAQPLVRASYDDPLGTYATNVMGTAHVLNAVRKTGKPCAIVVITTDKCYENREWEWAYRETDRLGGYDPYSNSKACAELVVSAYRNSFFHPAEYQKHGIALASVRAGNVIGGGDWADNRLIPDIIRAYEEGRSVRIRNPHAIRPWQHVLEPLRGYIAVAEHLLEFGSAYGEAWNFGPEQSDAQPVEWIVRELAELWGNGAKWELEGGIQPHEAQNLKLDYSKALYRMGWKPALSLKDALKMTADWYWAKGKGQEMHSFTIAQISQYESLSDKMTKTGISCQRDEREQ